MAIEIRVPALGESITEATVAQWYKKPGDAVAQDEPLCELETDKVTIEVPAQATGVLLEITASDGATVEVGGLLGSIDADASAKPQAPPPPKTDTPAKTDEPSLDDLSPAVRRLAQEHGLDPSTINGTGKGGRITKGDVLKLLENKMPAREAQGAREERVRMTRLRQTIAKRLKESQNTAAMLTTFNEVDMGALMDVRAEHKQQFEQKHAIRLGFMGFFVKACIVALADIPAVNAEISGDEIIYKNYVNMGIAVGTERGLVVPVLRDAQALSLPEIEQRIGDFGRRARDGKLAVEDLQDGSFTISNGGVYGSLMSTPILNAPQSGILGMHKIQERPVALNGAVAIRPMMYLALSYDHRIVDGKDAVTFLVRVKECLENPERLLLDL